MTPLVEFHVSSLWGLKPYGVREIISQLRGSGLVSAHRHLISLLPFSFRLSFRRKD
jgi:hypothetical protein